MPNSIILSTGSYLPEKILTNKDMESIVDTTDEWITERTGIKQRHIAAEGELTSDLGAVAAKRALENAGLKIDDIDLIIVATTTPDETFPSTATKIQAKLGSKNSTAFDIQAVCSGFVYALTVADALISGYQYHRALVVGAETMSRIIDWEDRSSCVLFGDGAGATILQHHKVSGTGGGVMRGILSSHLHSDGSLHDILYADGGVSSTQTAGKLRMVGKDVFKHATQKMSSCVQEALEANNVTIDDLDWLVPHQANTRILQAVAKKLGIPESKVINTIASHANTSAASIPLALDHAVKEGKLNPGDLVMLEALGGGITWGSCLVRW